MRKPIIIFIASAFVLAACGSGLRDSRINPANWFGSSTSQDIETYTTEDGEVVQVNPLIGEKKSTQLVAANRQRATGSRGLFNTLLEKDEGPYQGTLVDQVTSLEVKRTTTGAIVNVTGVTSRQGAFDVRLVPANNGVPVDGVLTLELRALQPIQAAQGSERSRRIFAANALTNGDLENIRQVRVVARRNVRTSRR